MNDLQHSKLEHYVMIGSRVDDFYLVEMNLEARLPSSLNCSPIPGDVAIIAAILQNMGYGVELDVLGYNNPAIFYNRVQIPEIQHVVGTEENRSLMIDFSMQNTLTSRGISTCPEFATMEVKTKEGSLPTGVMRRRVSLSKGWAFIDESCRYWVEFSMRKYLPFTWCSFRDLLSVNVMYLEALEW